MLKSLKNHGFASIVEVIVTSIIFVVAAAGILATISMLRPQGEDSAKRLQAAYAGKGALDDLRRQIDAATWNLAGSNFDVDIHHGPFTTPEGFNIEWDVTDSASGVRRIDMNVTYPDT